MAPRESSSTESRLHPLFVEALQGNAEAYRVLLSTIRDIARSYALRKLSQRDDADDVVQEILMSVHKALHTYDPARPCMPWLGAIMHFRVNDWLRKHYTQAGRTHVPIEEVENFLLFAVTDEPLAHEYVNEAVSQLPENQRAVILAMYRDDLSVAETSERLGISVSNVKVTAHRAYKVLRKQLGES